MNMLSIGASGVRAYQAALTTTSENIANAGTPGFVRRSATIAEVSATGSSRNLTGHGAVVTGIGRAGDAFRATAVREAGSDLAKTTAGIVWLDRIEGALGGQKLDERLSAFFNAGTTLAANPSASAPRAAMVEAASAVAQAFAGGVRSLDAATAEVETTAVGAAAQLSEMARGLARVNDQLSRSASGGAGQAQLLDQRDQLLEQMSTIVDLDVQFDPVGRVTVRGGGATGALLVHGTNSASVRFTRGEAGEAQFLANYAGQDAELAPMGGAMAGMIEGAGRIADARAGLVDLARAFVADVNAVQSAGQDLAGNPGKEWFAVSADGIVSVAIEDGADIAAARPGGGPRDNGNLADLTAIRVRGGYEGRSVALSANNGAALAGRRTVAEAQTAIRETAVSGRDAASGVNLDQEAIDLLRFQQAYQASSRVIQVARETLDALFAIR